MLVIKLFGYCYIEKLLYYTACPKAKRRCIWFWPKNRDEVTVPIGRTGSVHCVASMTPV